MKRLDPICMDLHEQIKNFNNKLSELNSTQTTLNPNSSLSSEDTKKLADKRYFEDQIKLLEKKLRDRENILGPIYRQISITFADLHDTPGRMLTKDVIQKVLEWKSCRKFFYWRLRRLLAQDQIIKQMMSKSNDKIEYKDTLKLLKEWFDEASLSNSSQSLFNDKKFGEKNWENNEFVALWLENRVSNTESFITDKLDKFNHDNVLKNLKDIIENHTDIAIESIEHLTQSTSVDRIKQIIEILNKKVQSLENLSK